MTTVIVSGPIANKPGNGGIVWNELSYVLGLARLGFDVHFWEQIDERSCVDADGNPCGLDDSVNLAFFRHVTERFGFADKAALFARDGSRACGGTLAELKEVAGAAALLININGHLRHRELRSRIRRAVY